MSRTKKLLLVILALSVVYLASGVILTSTAASPYMNVKFLRVLVSAIIDGDLTIGDDLTVTDDLAVVGDLDVSGTTTVEALTAADDLDATAWFRMTPQTPIVIADDGWLTPTGTLQPIHAAGAIGFSKIYTTGFSNGDILILTNGLANSIVITDENDTNLGGDRTLGIGDNLTLWYTNTAWWELSTTNN